MPFVHFPQRPDALTADFASAEYEKLGQRAIEAEASASPECWVSLYRDWNAFRSYVHSEEMRLYLRHTRDMRDDASAEAERRFRDEVRPRAEDGESRLMAALLVSRHRAAVAAEFGQQLLRVLDVLQAPFAPINAQLRVEVGRLANEYDQRLANAEVSVGGRAMTLSRARGLMSSGNADVRREAFDRYFGWFRDERAELARIFSELVRRRHAMGRNLGHETFVPLGYASMRRVDYGPEQVQKFRDAVRTHFSPLFRELASAQAAALGTTSLRPWDMAYHPAFTLPQGVAEPVAEQLDKAERVFAKLSPKLRGHFRRMREQGLIDLENRPGKAMGGYCAHFHDANEVVLFCNSVGNEDDVRVLTHETGHAFQAWESQWIEDVMLREPTADAAEVHSMGMEFLCLPHLGEFFSADELERFTLGRWKRAIENLCHLCVGDHFQHWVYEHPDASVDERDRRWTTLCEDYLPGIDWSGEAESFRSCRWYSQFHIFRLPFYFIDYAVAEIGAIQLARLAHADSEGALAKYLELCRLGGTRSVLELFATAGLRSPLDPEVTSDLADHVRKVLHLRDAG
jgi:M3 family oligoendopeptidase